MFNLGSNHLILAGVGVRRMSNFLYLGEELTYFRLWKVGGGVLLFYIDLNFQAFPSMITINRLLYVNINAGFGYILEGVDFFSWSQ